MKSAIDGWTSRWRQRGYQSAFLTSERKRADMRIEQMSEFNRVVELEQQVLELKDALRDVMLSVDCAILRGDWEVQMGCDPDPAMKRAEEVLK
jgi:hypothetical protein